MRFSSNRITKSVTEIFFGWHSSFFMLVFLEVIHLLLSPRPPSKI